MSWCLQTRLDEVPLYVVVKEVLSKEAHIEAVEINYLTFYAFNGPYTVGVPPMSFEAGAHDGDWEHFTVRWAHRRSHCSLCGFISPLEQRGARSIALPVTMLSSAPQTMLQMLVMGAAAPACVSIIALHQDIAPEEPAAGASPHCLSTGQRLL